MDRHQQPEQDYQGGDGRYQSQGSGSQDRRHGQGRQQHQDHYYGQDQNNRDQNGRDQNGRDQNGRQHRYEEDESNDMW